MRYTKELLTERLLDIQETITNITKYTSQGRKRFDEDELVQNWVILHLEMIGEMARAIPQDFTDQHPEIAWERFSGMPNIIHHYFEIDQNRIWQAVEQGLPVLKAAIETILHKEESHDQ